MRKLDFTICLLLSLLVSLACKATAAAEVTSQGPRGAASPTADYSDPKKTYETYLHAIKTNDLEAAKKCWFFADNDPQGALDVLVGLWVTAHRLGEVARDKLGPRGWAVLQEWNGAEKGTGVILGRFSNLITVKPLAEVALTFCARLRRRLAARTAAQKCRRPRLFKG